MKFLLGIANWVSDSRDKYDGNQTDRTPTDTSKLNRKESYKAQRKNYRLEKKRVASELLNSLQDPTVTVLADWLKVRGTLKSWTKLWCVVKPGLLLLYKSPKTKSSHWVGTILLTSCQVIERPSKKDGFCFKLFHPLEQSIWAPRGPEKETIGAVVQPLPTAYLIFRAPSQAAGKCWMDALELSLRCSALLLRSNSNSGAMQSSNITDSAQMSHETQWSEADYEKHFNDQDLDDSQNEGAGVPGGESEFDTDEEGILETPYEPRIEDEFGATGEQVEELADENKSLIWILLKQVRPGMDLSKVVLPTFILEPRSFLDKLSDSYYHADVLSCAVLQEDPFIRMKLVVKWYLSGFYKKPKGLKKPYNPILGEVFRCYWEHPNGSRTFYIAEQVSHHPPISAFFVTNREDGFCISCSILAKSKFYGNSTSAVLEGIASLSLLPRGEIYTMTTPYAHCKGILMGTLSMELGGKISIDCESTGYKTELEFKLKSMFGGSDSNLVVGKIKFGKDIVATIHGHWDSEIRIKDTKTSQETILFAADPETRKKRLIRYVVPLDNQLENESERLWEKVSDAIRHDDQTRATEEKTILEEFQRGTAKQRKSQNIDWIPINFQIDSISKDYLYKYADLRPWDPSNDIRQYEVDFMVLTKTRIHRNLDMQTVSGITKNQSFRSHQSRITQNSKISQLMMVKSKSKSHATIVIPSDSSQSNEEVVSYPSKSKSVRKLIVAIDQVNRALDDHTRQLEVITAKLDSLQRNSATSNQTIRALQNNPNPNSSWIMYSIPQSTVIKAIIYLFIAIFVAFLIKWLFK